MIIRATPKKYQDVFYLNAWEFQMLWEVKVLPKPKHLRATLKKNIGVTASSSQECQEDLHLHPPELTIWNDRKNEDESKGFSVNPEAVKYYGDSGILRICQMISNLTQLTECRNTDYEN